MVNDNVQVVQNLPAIQDCGDDNSSVHLAIIRDTLSAFAKLKVLDSPPKELLVLTADCLDLYSPQGKLKARLYHRCRYKK